MDDTRQPPSLGELETAVMAVLWERGEASVQEVRRALRPERELAYTTILTVLSRLHDKGLVARHKVGRAHVYSAASEREEVSASILDGIVGSLLGGSRTRAVALLLEGDEDVPDEELSRLEELIRERRRRGRS